MSASLKGSWQLQCPKCQHNDSMRGYEDEPPSFHPTCTNPECRFGRNTPTGMQWTGFLPDKVQ